MVRCSDTYNNNISSSHGEDHDLGLWVLLTLLLFWIIWDWLEFNLDFGDVWLIIVSGTLFVYFSHVCFVINWYYHVEVGILTNSICWVFNVIYWCSSDEIGSLIKKNRLFKLLIRSSSVRLSLSDYRYVIIGGRHHVV